MLDSVRFAKPPILELMLGVQFSPLSRVTVAHLGWFWRELGKDWVDLSDGPALSDQFERFDQTRKVRSPQPIEWRINTSGAMGRLAIGHRRQDRLLQVQASQFRFHWRWSPEGYPKYERLIQEFGELFDKFSIFTDNNQLGPILLNQWDLTYVNAFPRGEEWDQPADWKNILPGLFGVPPVAEGLMLDTRSATWSYVIAPEVGRLHINAGSQVVAGQPAESLVLHLTARGPIRGGTDENQLPRPAFDIGHDAILKTFLQITSPQMHEKWGRIS